MGVSTDAILFYGFHIKEGEEPWGEDEACDDVEKWLAARLGVHQPLVPFEGNEAIHQEYWKECREALKPIDGMLGFHCSNSYPMAYVCATGKNAGRGYPEKLESFAVPEDAERRLRRFCAVAGINYDEQEVGWWLASYWG